MRRDFIIEGNFSQKWEGHNGDFVKLENVLVAQAST